MEPEVTYICFDDTFMMNYEVDTYRDQAKAIMLYAEAKLKSHPENLVGVLGFGDKRFNNILLPCRDLKKLPDYLKCLTCSGRPDFESLFLAHGWMLFILNGRKGFQPTPANNSVKKRIVIFTGCPTLYGMEYMMQCGTRLKQKGVAVDLVNFSKEDAEYYKALVDASNNGESHIVHVPAGSSICKVLSSTPTIFPPPPIKEVEVAAKGKSYVITPSIFPDPNPFIKEVEVVPSRKGEALGREDDDKRAAKGPLGFHKNAGEESSCCSGS